MGQLLDFAPPSGIKDPLNRETQRILDAAGRFRNVTKPRGQKTRYRPDAFDRITQFTDAISRATVFTYDANSNLLTATDAKSQQSGNVATVTGHTRIVSKSFPFSTVPPKFSAA